MTPVPATITVDFISNYAGVHRVCWRMGLSGPYDCTTLVNCAGGGTSCQATIPISVDNETCDNVVFDGYVQATCNDEGSLDGRIPFQSTFVPDPVCKPYTISCINAAVASINVIDGGSGYDPMAAPAVSILGGGVGATATALVTDGGLLTWSDPGAQGQGYNPGVYFNVPFTTISGVGSGAIASQVTVDGSGNIDSVNVILDSANPGSGYMPGDSVSLDAAALGGSTPTQAFLVDVITTDTGRVYAVTLDTPGSGYTVGSGTIAPPAMGVTATIEVLLEPCPNFVLPDGCEGNPPFEIIGMEIGQSVDQCLIAMPEVIPAGFEVNASLGCCYNCSQVTFTVGLTGVTLYYTDCVTKAIVTTVAAPSQVVGPVCAVNNSWWWTDKDNPVAIITTPGCP